MLRYFVVFLLSFVATACSQSGPDNLDAGAQIKTWLENEEILVTNEGMTPPPVDMSCSNLFRIDDVEIVDKKIDGKDAVVSAKIHFTAVKDFDDSIVFPMHEKTWECFGLSFVDKKWVAGRQGTGSTYFRFQLWDSGWKIAGRA